MKINSIIGDADNEMEEAGDATVGGGDETEDMQEDTVQNIFPFINPNPKLRKNDVDFYASVIWSQRYNKNILDYLLKPVSKPESGQKTTKKQKKLMKKLLNELSLKYKAVITSYSNDEDGLMQHLSEYCFESSDRSEEDKKCKYSIFVSFKENNYNQEKVKNLIDEDSIIILNDPMANEKNRENPQTSISWGLPFTKDDSDSQFSLELYGNLYKIFRGIDEDGHIPLPPKQNRWTITRENRIVIFYKYFWRYFLPVLTELQNTLPEHQFKNPLLKKVLIFVWSLPKTKQVHLEYFSDPGLKNLPIFARMGLIENLGRYRYGIATDKLMKTDELDIEKEDKDEMMEQANLLCEVIAKGFFELINQLILCACNFNPEPLYGLVWQENTENTETDPDKEIIIHKNLIPDKPGNFFRIPWSAYRTMPFKYQSSGDIKVTKLDEDNFILIPGLKGTDEQRKFFAIDPQRGNISRYLQAYNRVLDNMKAIFVLKEKQKGTKIDSLTLNLSELEIKNDDEKDYLSLQISQELKDSITPKLAKSYKYACDDFVQKLSLKRNKGAEEYEEYGKLVQDDDDEMEKITAPIQPAVVVEAVVVEEDAPADEADKSDKEGMVEEDAPPRADEESMEEEDESDEDGMMVAGGKRHRDPENGGESKKLKASKKWKKIKNYLLNLKF